MFWFIELYFTQLLLRMSLCSKWYIMIKKSLLIEFLWLWIISVDVRLKILTNLMIMKKGFRFKIGSLPFYEGTLQVQVWIPTCTWAHHRKAACSPQLVLMNIWKLPDLSTWLKHRSKRLPGYNYRCGGTVFILWPDCWPCNSENVTFCYLCTSFAVYTCIFGIYSRLPGQADP